MKWDLPLAALLHILTASPVHLNLLLSLWTQKLSLKLFKYFQQNTALLQMSDFFMHFFPLYWGFCLIRKKLIQQNAPHLVTSGKIKSRGWLGFFQFMPLSIHF